MLCTHTITAKHGKIVTQLSTGIQWKNWFQLNRGYFETWWFSVWLEIHWKLANQNKPNPTFSCKGTQKLVLHTGLIQSTGMVSDFRHTPIFICSFLYRSNCQKDKRLWRCWRVRRVKENQWQNIYPFFFFFNIQEIRFWDMGLENVRTPQTSVFPISCWRTWSAL